MLTGEQSQLSTELRIKVVGEMVKNRSLYDAGDFLKYGADNFEEDMLDSIRGETYSSFRHMYALANVVCCNIRYVYPESKDPFCQTKWVKRNNLSSGKNWKRGVDIMATHNKYWFSKGLVAKSFCSFDPWTTHSCKTKQNPTNT